MATNSGQLLLLLLLTLAYACAERCKDLGLSSCGQLECWQRPGDSLASKQSCRLTSNAHPRSAASVVPTAGMKRRREREKQNSIFYLSILLGRTEYWHYTIQPTLHSLFVRSGELFGTAVLECWTGEGALLKIFSQPSRTKQSADVPADCYSSTAGRT